MRMRRNRKVKKHSRFAANVTGVVSLMVCGLIMLMISWAMESRCSGISREMAAAESRLKALDATLGRETARWNVLIAPENLKRQLTRLGIEMDLERATQIVRMGRDGRPEPGQITVARAQARAASGAGRMAAAVAPRRTAAVRR